MGSCLFLIGAPHVSARQCYVKAASAANFGGNRDVAVEAADKGPYVGKAYALAGNVLRPGTTEQLEDSFMVHGGNSPAVIGHLDGHPLAVARGGDIDRPRF